MRLTPEIPAFGFALLAGAAAYLPFTVLVTLGQDYLPNRIGTASGVTLGLAVSAGGLVNPLFGLVADASGPATVIWVIAPLPILAFLIALTLPTLAKDRRQGSIWTQLTGRGKTTVADAAADQEPSPVPTDRNSL
jgi:FSR family fosmidomycin resistance protein-like MFS transporter